MPRKAREKSKTGIYHIMLRGINGQTISEDDEDNEKFLQTISECKKVSDFKLYGYCLMGNHIHMLIKTGKEEIDQILKRLGSRYVYWYNLKYARSGHLFQDRFKSEAVEDDAYFMTVLRYIHQNPVKANLCKVPYEYKWSSYNDYITQKGITDVMFGLEIIGGKNFVNYTNELNNDNCLEIETVKKRLTDKELADKITNELKIDPANIKNEPKEKRTELLKAILKYEGVSTRQLSRVTGISTNIIWRM